MVDEFAERLFDGPLPWSRIRQGHKLLRLGQRYTSERLDSSCRRALEHQETPQQPPTLPAGRFARPGDFFSYRHTSMPGGQS